MVLGLGSGLALALPMAELLNPHSLRGATALINPFAAWSSAADEDLLLLGTDEGGGNTDVIATLRIDGGNTRITQIPRDSYIESDQYGPIKINALYALGGVDAVKRELSSRLGRPVQHHLVINLSAIRRLADQLGGIEVTVPKRMRYVDNTQGLNIDLQPGRQILRGRDLEGFLRFRHDDMGDIGRLERQQLALKALFRKLTSPEQLVRLPGLMMGSQRDLITDLGPMELGGLLTAMGSTELATRRLGGQPFDRDGVSYWQTEWPSGSTDPAAETLPSSAAGTATERPYRFLF